MNIAETYAMHKRLLRKKIGGVSLSKDKVTYDHEGVITQLMYAINSETIKHYFDLLKSTLKENGLMNSPLQIYNVDESGMQSLAVWCI